MIYHQILRFSRGSLSCNPVLLVHGGAWAIPGDLVEAHLNGVRNALSAGWRVLEGGGSALDAVEEAVVVSPERPKSFRHVLLSPSPPLVYHGRRPTKAVLRFQHSKLSAVCGKAALHSSKSGQARVVRTPRGLGLEQFSPLHNQF
jgi:hypothetical protein